MLIYALVNYPTWFISAKLGTQMWCRPKSELECQKINPSYIRLRRLSFFKDPGGKVESDYYFYCYYFYFLLLWCIHLCLIIRSTSPPSSQSPSKRGVNDQSENMTCMSSSADDNIPTCTDTRAITQAHLMKSGVESNPGPFVDSNSSNAARKTTGMKR